MRLFLAINLPVAERSAIGAATATMRELAPELAWVDDARLHLTLKFLGEQPAERVTDIAGALARIAGRHGELEMELGEVGAFPNFRRARVVWLAVAQHPKLELLHHDVEVECEQLGFELDGRPFRPHLTLARVKAALPEERMRKLRREARRLDYHGDFIVRSIDLMQSDISASGPSYTTLVSAALRSG